MSARVSGPGDLDWLISSRCEGGQCIKVARMGESVVVASTDDPEGYVSEFSTDEWRQFVAGVKLGDFDGIA
jgi:Domain of unknown function (DUF397)